MKNNSVPTTAEFFPFRKMTKLTKKRESARVSKERQEEHARNGQSRNRSVRRFKEEVVTKILHEIEGRVIKKTVPGNQKDSLPNFGCSVKLTRVSFEPTDTDALWNRSGNFPETRT